MEPKKYQDYVKKNSKKSPIFKDCCFAFIIGGIICTIAQLFYELISYYFNLDHKVINEIVMVVMVFLGALFTAIGWYNRIAKYGGAGTIVPITGFANAVVSAAMDFKSEGLIVGLGSKIFNVAGPVIVYGVITSIAIGIIYKLFGLV